MRLLSSFTPLTLKPALRKSLNNTQNVLWVEIQQYFLVATFNESDDVGISTFTIEELHTDPLSPAGIQSLLIRTHHSVA